MLKIREIKPKLGFIGRDRQSILEDLYFAVKNEFNCYEIQAAREIHTDDNFNLGSGAINHVKKILKENNIYLNLHISHFNNLGSIKPELSKRDLFLVKKEIILAKEIGAKQITIHGGNKDNQGSEATVAKNFKILIKNLEEIVKLGKKLRIKIGLENAFDPSRLCRTPEDLLKAVNSVKGLGITFDTGHANVINFDPTEYFRKVKKFIINIHLHDNDGIADQHALIGEGNIDFKSILRECKNSGYYGPFILEVFPYKNVLKCREKFLNLWDQI